jgi:hypothetical protein
MSRWVHAVFNYKCSRCPDHIYPGDTMRFDDAGRPVCVDCGEWGGRDETAG